MADDQAPIPEDLPALMAGNLAAMSDDLALRWIAVLIDSSEDGHSAEGASRALGMLKELGKRELAPDKQAVALYFRANALNVKRVAATVPGPRAWEQPDRQEQILTLFMARNHAGFKDLAKVWQCRILTNLGVQLNEVGRFIDAIEAWDGALAVLPNFAMAHASKGLGLQSYAMACEEPYQRETLLFGAHGALVRATADDTVWESGNAYAVSRYCKTQARYWESVFDMEAIAADLVKDERPLGRGHVERSYRRWCLNNRLFVNPLNDVLSTPVAAADDLMLASLTVGFTVEGVPPAYGLFNQLKQEFAFARLMLFESEQDGGVHYADRHVGLTNTLDYTSLSMRTEKLRTAFRLAYSLLDKIGYFINFYWALGRKEQDVSFRTVWYAEGKGPRSLHPRFDGYENWPLHGLFWLAMDIFEDAFQRVTNVDAREFAQVRNDLEHRHLRVHEGWAKGLADVTNGPGHAMSEGDLRGKALRLVKFARAALIHLSLAVHLEERRKREASPSEFVLQMPLTQIKDRWKGTP